MKQLLLEAPDGHLADSVKWTIEEWNEEPTALQILKTLDYCAYFAGASTFTMQCLMTLLDGALSTEGTTREQLELTGLLSWRNATPFTD